MRTVGWIAAAGAGAALLLRTDTGRRWMSQAGDSLQRGYGQIRDAIARRRTEGMVQEAVEQPHPDTTVARAFEEAVS